MCLRSSRVLQSPLMLQLLRGGWSKIWCKPRAIWKGGMSSSMHMITFALLQVRGVNCKSLIFRVPILLWHLELLLWMDGVTKCTAINLMSVMNEWMQSLQKNKVQGHGKQLVEEKNGEKKKLINIEIELKWTKITFTWIHYTLYN